ncbi:UMTA methyltransferase family protein-like protein [Melanomma pulvis-pyrius CBS 109.77]|uniref:UMTA methyltransferase family protein-like protein n=1 Tax=Melanomma pulvis-pyrius CBS 109.77 TaxID=1314802 RepID=A0A6A6WT37_9PLEO|nr:UMTA methyltransferase family protein-like protein [Melanomma pulvis-pyrius CBS 109.77]
MADLRKNYVISHGFDESGRLHLQQWLWRSQLGWNIHPAIELSKSGGVRIADHGCGNAAWLLSIASELEREQYSHVSFFGFDVAGVHYPASQNIPQNVKLGILDAFADNIPEEHVGQYDVVHVRVFTAVVKNNDPKPLIRNAYKMLKPGGYLQWDEFDGGSFKAVAPGSNPDTSSVTVAATQEMLDTSLQSSQRAMNLKYSWVGMLGSLFEQCGLDVIEEKRMDVKNELRKAMTDSLLMMLSHVARIAVRDGNMIGTDKNWNELWTKAGDEIGQGVSITMDMLVVVGRKPLD